MATTAILKFFVKILEALECLVEEQSQKGDKRYKSYNLFLCGMRVCKSFIKQILQNEDVNLKTRADLYGSLADQLPTLEDYFERFEAKVILPDVDYNAAKTCKRVRKKVLNNGDAHEVDLNARDKVHITTFYTIVDKLKTQMRRDVQRNSKQIFLS
ncbi:uncharacterized protein LOC143230752 isoform X1 [Tachypleus tridentatus]|uniref:uncharacterized protein LOC143230752 isoform X1 n=1 Tax=Tachypleus tridentatus TaxID=6853 RepID=UPI003FD4E164